MESLNIGDLVLCTVHIREASDISCVGSEIHAKTDGIIGLGGENLELDHNMIHLSNLLQRNLSKHVTNLF